MRVLVIAVVVAAARLASAEVVIEKVGVEVAPTDPQGKPWDRGSVGTAPDLEIEISIDGNKVKRCAKVNDALVAECEAPERAPSATSIRLDLQVEDVDLVHDEVIGNAHATIAADASGRIELAVDGKAIRAWAEVRRVGEAWVSSRVAWPLGGFVGAALALLVFAKLRRRYLTPGAARDPDRHGPAVEAEPSTRFWRSPVLLTGAACAITAVIIAHYVRGPTTQPLYAAIPFALGGFCITGTIIDAFVHEHLGATRSRVIVAGVVAMAAVPTFQWIGGLFGMIQMIIGAFILALIIWSVLDSI